MLSKTASKKSSRYWWIGVVAVLALAWYLLPSGNGTTAKTGVAIGNTAPSFTATTIDGETIDSDEFLGKVVVITSSAAWCNTCVIEAKEFASVFEKYKNDDVVFLTVDIDSRNSKSAIQEFIVNTTTPWRYISAPEAQDMIDALRLNRFEITYVIDRSGIIRFKDHVITTHDVLENAIRQVL